MHSIHDRANSFSAVSPISFMRAMSRYGSSYPFQRIFVMLFGVAHKNHDCVEHPVSLEPNSDPLAYQLLRSSRNMRAMANTAGSGSASAPGPTS
jgi:hypothetical protein